MHHHGSPSGGTARLAMVVVPPGNDHLVGNDGAWTAEAIGQAGGTPYAQPIAVTVTRRWPHG
ncbi:hypothetical protein GCM10027176_31460 [Actinoallomurus bryophytorum]